MVILVAAVVGGLLVAWPHLNDAPALEENVTRSSVSRVGAKPPVVGTGPLLRLARVVERDGRPATLEDPYTHETVRELTKKQASRLAGERYVIERFGYSEAANRTISLTFDDGPDPRYTPQLLDLLSREKVPATFFVTGEQAVKHPELVERMVREGHAVANHTFRHPDLADVGDARLRAELTATDRIIRATGRVYSNIVRLPYGGNDTRSVQADTTGIVRAQELGYVAASFDFDSSDWKYDGDDAPSSLPTPKLDGHNITVLLHDAGGERSVTMGYLKRLIPAAREARYTFHTMPQVAPVLDDNTGPVTPSVWDRLTLGIASVLVVWPGRLVSALFALAVLSVIVGGLVSVGLAAVRRFRRRRQFTTPPDLTRLSVTVLIAAFNEEEVIADTLSALLRSDYPDLELLVIDDGSTDHTAEVVRGLAARDPRIRLIRQKNGGKALALDRGIVRARGEILVTLDADTQFTPHTIRNLVRHFAVDRNGRLGAVAGVVKVGNLRNVLTRWQAIEYISQIGVERAAQDALGAIMIVPGACAAWRKSAVVEAGGYSKATLAEDFDLTMMLHQLGYRVTQDDEAIAYTEAPESLRALLKQRTRWVFGSVQVLWKHQFLLFNPRYGWLGMVLMPFTATSIVVPLLFLPFVYALAITAAHAYGLAVVLIYVLLFFVAHFIVAAVGVWLMRERPSHLLMIPIYRLIAEPLRIYLLYKALYTALKGTKLGWNKLIRTGTVSLSIDSADAALPEPVVTEHQALPETVPLEIPVTRADALTTASPARSSEQDPALTSVTHGPTTAGDPRRLPSERGWLWEALRGADPHGDTASRERRERADRHAA